MKKQITLLIAVTFAILTSNNIFAQLVTSGADDGTNGTLRNEIADTPAGGIVLFAPNVSVVTLNSELLIDKALIIAGISGTNVIIDADEKGRAFKITAGPVVLNNLNIINGIAANGGGIYLTNAVVTVNNCIISSNTANAPPTPGPAGSGGGIFNDVGGILFVNDTEISSNIANRAGGGIEDKSGSGLSITLNNVDFIDNNAGVEPAVAAPGNGGALHISGSGSIAIIGGTVSGNIAAQEGGGLWNGSGTMTISNVDITDNEAQGAAADDGGGGIFNNGGTLNVQNGTTITGNTATGTLGSGGGIFTLTPGTLNVDGLTISGNTAMRAGGGIEIASAAGEIYAFNDVTLDGNTVFGPAPGNGGGLHISGPGNVNYIGGSVINNTAFEGGGLWNGSGTMTVSGTTFTGNTANGNVTGGGALFNNGGTLVVDAATTLTGNIAMAATPGGRGGAIFNNTGGTLTLENGLTIAGNYASRAGGAIEDSSNGTLILNGISLTGNSAGVDIGLGMMANPGNGGALHLSGTTNVNITGFSTISNNLAALERGGLWNNLGTMSVDISFIEANIASDAAADDGGGGVFNNGGTLQIGNAAILSNNKANGASGSGGGILSVAGDVTVTDALFGFNVANRAGGAIELIDGNLTVSGDYNISDNNAGVAPAVASPGNGGAVHISGSANATFTGGTFENNVAAREGGALWNSTGTMTVDGVAINSNTASGNAADDGGAGIFNNGGTLIVQNNTMITNNISNGTSGSGGGLLSVGGIVTVNGSSITNNQANRAGGGIELAGGTLNLVNATLDTNNAGISPAMASPGNGGGLHVTGAATTNITGGTTNDNIAANEGGGLWNGSGLMTVINHTVDGNMASGNDATVAGAAGGGGIYNEGGTLNLSGTTTIANNVADGAQSTGGGILNAAGTLMANDITIMANTSNRAGGGIETNGGGAVMLMNVTLNSNETGIITSAGAPGNGGGLHVSGNSIVNVTGGTVNMNTAASEGGGLWNGAGIMIVDGTLLDGNEAQGNDADNGGGALFNNGGTLNVINETVVSNNRSSGASGSGGGLLSTAGSVTVSNTTFDLNSANRAGGAIELIDGTLDFSNSVMNNNDVNGTAGTPAPGNGGGLHVTGTTGTLNITTSTISGNVAFNEGGGLWNQNGTTMTVSNTTLNDNSADEGAGIFNNGGAITTIMTSTISGNTAATSGGGITSKGASLVLNAVTIAQNSADLGGGIDAVTSVSLKNTVVALNTATSGNDVSGTITSNDYNLIGMDDLNVFTPQGNDLEGVDPLLGPLQDNGGTTLTHQLLENSPAFDAGAPGDNFDDQIGQPVFGTNRDIGAFESQAVLSIADFNAISDVKIYPNPTSGLFNIAIGNNISGSVDVQIVSITGKLVQKLTLGNGVNNVDLSGMSSGLYIINISTENSSFSHKLILD